MHEIVPKFPHDAPSYWGKPLDQLLDFEILQVYENFINLEKKREEAKKHPKFNDPKKKLFLPEPNQNYKSLKEAILNEMNKRNIEP